VIEIESRNISDVIRFSNCLSIFGRRYFLRILTCYENRPATRQMFLNSHEINLLRLLNFNVLTRTVIQQKHLKNLSLFVIYCN